jgi:hypothetical protein
MDSDNIMAKAIASTKSKEETAPMSDMPEDDGTITVPKTMLADGAKEGDIIQFEVIADLDDQVALKPVEARIKQDGATSSDVKASGADNSSVGMK